MWPLQMVHKSIYFLTMLNISVNDDSSNVGFESPQTLQC